MVFPTVQSYIKIFITERRGLGECIALNRNKKDKLLVLHDFPIIHIYIIIFHP